MIGKPILFKMNTRMAQGELRPGFITFCHENGTFDAVVFTRGGQDGVRDFVVNASRISPGDGPEQFHWLNPASCQPGPETAEETVHAVHAADTATATESIG